MTSSELYSPPEYRVVTIKTIDGETIQGKINIGHTQRISDFFSTHDASFIITIEGTSKELAGKTLLINKQNIIWIELEDNESL